MAESMMWCENKHPDGVCKITGEYCVEGPCPDERPVEYAPVRHGKWKRRGRNLGACSECGEVTHWTDMPEFPDDIFSEEYIIPRDQWEDAARYE